MTKCERIVRGCADGRRGAESMSSQLHVGMSSSLDRIRWMSVMTMAEAVPISFRAFTVDSETSEDTYQVFSTMPGVQPSASETTRPIQFVYRSGIKLVRVFLCAGWYGVSEGECRVSTCQNGIERWWECSPSVHHCTYFTEITNHRDTTTVELAFRRIKSCSWY